MEILVARQPIFDQSERVVGYELLYRPHRFAVRAPEHTSTEMSNSVIVDAFLGIGLDRVTGGRPAFLNCGRELLLSGTLELLHPRQVVLEVLESVEPDDAVVAACRRLAEAGYRIALDDFVYDERWEPLLRIAEIVKVDVLAEPRAALEPLVARLRPYGVRLLAEKVESPELREFCADLGFELFQGFLYSRPEMLSGRDISVPDLQLLKLLNLVRDVNVPDARIEEAFRVDVSLSYKLLRIANSAAVGGSGISSIGHAIRLLGRQALHRWLALLLVASVRRRGGMSAERVHTALVRGRFCERLAQRTGDTRSAGSLFLVGLFSLLDQLLEASMEDILERMVLDAPIREALLRRSGPYGPVLSVVEAYENGRWEELPRLASSLELDPDDLGPLYLEALAWSRDHLPEADAVA